MAFSFKSFSAALAGLLLAASVAAQPYPNKPVTLMVPYPAGGLSDVIARTVNNTLSKNMGQPVIVENLGGASGSIAAQKVLNSPSDGQIIFQGSPNELILAPLAISAVKFKSEDFRLVQMIATAQIAFLARKDLPVSNVDEFLDYARKQAKEGKPVTYASVGPGSFYHLLGEHLSKVTNIEMTHVPYKGAAPANQDLLGGQVDIFLAPFGKSYEELNKQPRHQREQVAQKLHLQHLDRLLCEEGHARAHRASDSQSHHRFTQRPCCAGRPRGQQPIGGQAFVFASGGQGL